MASSWLRYVHRVAQGIAPLFSMIKNSFGYFTKNEYAMQVFMSRIRASLAVCILY